ncbi:RNA polymerase, alpha subunit [Corchorus olitorius]|uniref:DNA-directed RNA polymerase subunit n=1 Tax=Corchorus olitorius TaxID=93759 RepID=A0A1R3HIU3_9ROSI|nr:RNA polymerase, alpha subunit [Corchorus olitorius]
MAQTEGATDSVEAIWFNFMTTEEVRKQSVLKVTNANLLDLMERPMPGGLYDPALGPLEDRVPCKSCGALKLHCPGHCGHIDLVSPIYNPLLFNFLNILLQRTCFFCYHFRAERTEVERCVSKLKLIGKGDIVGAKMLDSDSTDASSYPEYGEGSQELGSTVHDSETVNPKEWTSLQLREAISVLDNFLKLKYKKCKNCDAKNPTIEKPIFGWFYTRGMSGAQMRENVIRGCTMVDTFSGEAGSGLEDANDAAVSSGSVDTDEMDTTETGFAAAEHSGPKARKKKAQIPLEFMKQKNLFSGPLLPSEVKKITKLLWENEVELCSLITDIQQQGFGRKEGYSMLFLETILVPPIKFRAPTKGGDSVMEHPQTVLLNKVLQANISLGNAYTNELKSSKVVVRRWMDLQQSVNLLFDNKNATVNFPEGRIAIMKFLRNIRTLYSAIKESCDVVEEYLCSNAKRGLGRRDQSSGICQLLEKKEGMFRQKMMGKRVNFACRSVISPDPYLAVNEIGIPPNFALTLTYPERVTPWNTAKLREAIVNGPQIHPGATHYIDKLSTQKLPPDRKARITFARKLPSSRGAITQPGNNFDNEFEGKTVLRHLRDGDVVLVNRQPTLHKPSIMAHRVRVLEGEKTIRMHYANCSTYNADFDGDEINVHFPQDEISRAEAYNIVDANNQYVRPSNGEPLRALIQDNIVSSVLLTKRDTFLSTDEFNQLLYSSGVSSLSQCSFSSKPGQKVSISSSEEGMLSTHSAILKPVPLWTGKQVITAVLNHITRNRPPFTMEKTGKIPHDFFRNRSTENKPSIRQENQPKIGLKRKKSKNSKEKAPDEEKMEREPDEENMLIHKNDFLRGVIDKAQFADYGLVHTVQELYGSNTAGILLSVFSRLFTVFLQMHGFTCGVDDLLIMKGKDIERKKQLEDCEKKVTEAHYELFGVEVDTEKAPTELQLKIERNIRRDGENALTALDRKMISVLNENSSRGVLAGLLSEGLVKSMGKNCIAIMTTSGAKGSKVNFQQISSYLGQQELEGKRVPRMVSGKTLPCFHPWDWAARAGGFISDRFLSGLRPQEYYFHCMAGREGLDFSLSSDLVLVPIWRVFLWYCWMGARDVDGLVDTAVKTSRSGYLQRCLIKNLECLKISYDHTVRDADGSIVQFNYGEDGIDVHQISFIAKFETLALNQDMMSEKFGSQLEEPDSHIKLPKGLKQEAVDFIKKLGGKQQQKIKQKDFLKLLNLKFLSSLAQPGEPVGVLAAQSVGEPSTQMTLNTFHLAGRGEMNVTLGIPRLQEIVMTASADIRTPVMTCPLRKGKTKEEAFCLADKMKRITVADILESMKVSVTPFAVHNGDICSIYKLKMRLGKPGQYFKNSDITVEDCEHILKVVFLRDLEDAIHNHLVLLSRISGIKNFMADSRKGANEAEDIPENKSHGIENDDDDDDDHEEAGEDLGLDAQKQKWQTIDEVDYEDGSEEENGGASSAGLLSEIDMSEDEDEDENENENGTIEDKVIGSDHGKDDISLNSPNIEKRSKSREDETKSEPQRKKKRVKFVRKETDRAIFDDVRGLHFEVHFKLIDEPRILLAQIAEKTAKKVYIQSFGKIDQCRVTDCSENQVFYYGENPKERKKIEKKNEIPALHTTGVDFGALWQMDDSLDVRYLYSNSIHAMLNTYGVEAARETIIREISHVFSSYSIAVNIRHLTLIADFMTQSGRYRPMSRLGGIADSISPLSKMSFETASKFIVEAAKHGLVDNMEAPSARICLGLPVKMGTGSFDLLHKVDI